MNNDNSSVGIVAIVVLVILVLLGLFWYANVRTVESVKIDAERPEDVTQDINVEMPDVQAPVAPDNVDINVDMPEPAEEPVDPKASSSTL